MPEVAKDTRFLTNPLRSANQGALIPMVEARTTTRTTAELLDLTRKFAVPCSSIRNIAEVVADEQVAAAELIQPAEDAEVAGYKDVAIPLRLDGERPRADTTPPRPGEHTREILG
jgi:formyl-CoA transferase